MQIKRVVRKLLRRLAGLPRTPRELQRSLNLLATLRSVGWHQSARRGAPVDPLRRPIPFYNYAAIAWLSDRVSPNDRVFEFGSGHSTLWFAARTRSVCSVEHNPLWADRLRALLPHNAQITTATGDAYPETIAALADGHFDIIVVDGILRDRCVEIASAYLQPDGLLVLDNSDRPENHESLAWLRRRGFHQIDFVGLIPGYGDLSCTSVLFRDGGRWIDAEVLPAFLGGYVPPVQGGLVTT